MVVTCLPVHRGVGLRMAGGGTSTRSTESDSDATICMKVSLSKNRFRCVMR